MDNNQRRFWVGVVSKEHVEKGVKLGIYQVCHGKLAPLKRISKGDFIIYYSSRYKIDEHAPYQKFTAIGIVKDNTPYQVSLEGDFQPFRINVEYLDAKHLEIKPLIATLPFIKNKKSWGYVFRYGFLEIDKESFLIIAGNMLGYNPLDSSR